MEFVFLIAMFCLFFFLLAIKTTNRFNFYLFAILSSLFFGGTVYFLVAASSS